MSKSAREDRPWKYTGTFILGSPASEEDIRNQIVEGCNCPACTSNRKYLEWLKQMKDVRETHDEQRQRSISQQAKAH